MLYFIASGTLGKGFSQMKSMPTKVKKSKQTKSQRKRINQTKELYSNSLIKLFQRVDTDSATASVR